LGLEGGGVSLITIAGIGSKFFGVSEIFVICGVSEIFGGSEIFSVSEIFGVSELFGDSEIFGEAKFFGDSEILIAETFGGSGVDGAFMAGRLERGEDVREVEGVGVGEER
jgi:hypothetical protein